MRLKWLNSSLQSSTRLRSLVSYETQVVELQSLIIRLQSYFEHIVQAAQCFSFTFCEFYTQYSQLRLYNLLSWIALALVRARFIKYLVLFS